VTELDGSRGSGPLSAVTAELPPMKIQILVHPVTR